MIDWLALALVNTGWRLVSYRPASSPVDVTIFRLSRAGGDKQWSAPPSFLQLRPVRVTIVQPASPADAIAPLLKQFSEHPSFSSVTTLTLQQWVEDVHNHQGLVTHINAMPKLTQLCLRLSDEGRYFGRVDVFINTLARMRALHSLWVCCPDDSYERRTAKEDERHDFDFDVPVSATTSYGLSTFGGACVVSMVKLVNLHILRVSQWSLSNADLDALLLLPLQSLTCKSIAVQPPFRWHDAPPDPSSDALSRQPREPPTFEHGPMLV